jgi:hypothetical protein
MATTQQSVASIQQSDNCVTFKFLCFWYQEDIEFLKAKVFDNLPVITVLEVIEGADRVNIRFVWQNKSYFSLNFDCYSQSCWIEGEDVVSTQQLGSLITSIKVR